MRAIGPMAVCRPGDRMTTWMKMFAAECPQAARRGEIRGSSVHAQPEPAHRRDRKRQTSVVTRCGKSQHQTRTRTRTSLGRLAPHRTDLRRFHGVLFPNPFPNEPACGRVRSRRSPGTTKRINSSSPRRRPRSPSAALRRGMLMALARSSTRRWWRGSGYLDVSVRHDCGWHIRRRWRGRGTWHPELHKVVFCRVGPARRTGGVRVEQPGGHRGEDPVHLVDR